MIRRATQELTIELDAKAIGRRIAAARRSKRWRQADLATAVRVKEGTVANWEGGWRIPPIRALVGLAVQLRRSIDWIVAGCPKRGQLYRMAKRN